MHRFYCPSMYPPTSPDAAADSPATDADGWILSDFPARLETDEARHARTTLRLRPGDRVELISGRGMLAEASIDGFTGGEARLTVQRYRLVPDDGPRLDVAVAAPKGARAEQMANQLSQLGASRLRLLRTQRGVVEPGEGKQRRLQRVALEAAKQSGRAHLLDIDGPVDISDVLSEAHDVRLLAMPGADALDLSSLLRSASSVLVLIGPEGGFTQDETDAAIAAGALPWSLGPHIMRIETAAAAAAAILRHQSFAT